ncbi:hypothetical protein KEM48_013348 [Puccinia striiformis f. sp. tritici PST-130]|nr:hypothetical protein KEM48_013348 [Puccinia striiformis f. sp. tritici PST-130]
MMTIERKGFFTSLTETGGITPHPQPNSSIQSNLAFEDESVGSDIPKMAGFEVISKTLAEQLLVEDQPFQFHEQVFWRPYEAYVYVYDKSIDEQRAKGKLVDHQGTAKIALYGVFSCRCSQRKPMRDAIRADRNFLAGKHRKPDLSHLPRVLLVKLCSTIGIFMLNLSPGPAPISSVNILTNTTVVETRKFLVFYPLCCDTSCTPFIRKKFSLILM